MKNDTFANRLKIALKNNNVTQAELCKKTGLDKGLVSSYISGKYEAKQDKLVILSKFLNVSEVWLIGYDVPVNEEINNITQDEFAELVNKWINNPNISKEKKEEFLQKSMDDLKNII